MPANCAMTWALYTTTHRFRRAKGARFDTLVPKGKTFNTLYAFLLSGASHALFCTIFALIFEGGEISMLAVGFQSQA